MTKKNDNRINADSYFWQGDSIEHDINKDYAIAGKDRVIICDGCSGSSHSDFGARLIAHTALNYDMSTFSAKFGEDLIYISKDTYKSKNADETWYDATLLISHFDDVSGDINTYVFGDGVVALVDAEKITYWHIQYPSGAPLYLSYLLDRDRYRLLGEQFGYTRKVTEGVIYLQSDEHFEVYQNEDESIEPFKVSTNITCLDKNGAVVIMSDGVGSYKRDIITETSRIQERVPLNELLLKLLTFKNTNGRFIQRRARAFIKNCKVDGWSNFDDVSVAALSLSLI